MTLPTGASYTYTYDSYGRLSKAQYLYKDAVKITTTPTYTERTDSTSGQVYTTAQIKTWRNQAVDYDVAYSYTYDNRGNILSVVREAKNTNVKTTTSYTYDGLNQLTRENNQAAGKTWVYTYDAGGNILTKKEYAYTTGTVGTAVSTVTYGYNDSKGWKDLLTSYNGVTRTHDEIGNLISDGTWTYTWEGGRRLASMAKSGTNVSFTYDHKGIRLTKKVGNTTTRYTYWGNKLLMFNDGTNYGNVRYDDKGQAIALRYKGKEYFFIYNAQGDVVAIAKADGTVVVEYTYDAWGKILTCTGSMASTLGKYNPFRYRGYVYDEETGLYYLNSRYYDPKVGRFICADGYVMPNATLTGSNIFNYCDNNPVSRCDYDGKSWGDAWAAHKAGETIARMTEEERRNHYGIMDLYVRPLAQNLYPASYIAQVERSQTICASYQGNHLVYTTAQAYWGDTHEVTIMPHAPSGYTIAASLHTHPYSNSFSGIDIANANSVMRPSYLISPNEELKCYVPTQGIYSLGRIKMDYTSIPHQVWNGYVVMGKMKWDEHAQDAYFEGRCLIGTVNPFFANEENRLCYFQIR